MVDRTNLMIYNQKMKISSIEQRLHNLSIIARDNVGVNNARLVAAIYDGPRLISMGSNSRKTHPLQKQYSKHPLASCLHAEIEAIARAKSFLRKSDFKGLDLYIARVSFDNNRKNWWWSMARPCETGCMPAIVQMNMSRIFFTTGPKEFTTLKI